MSSWRIETTIGSRKFSDCGRLLLRRQWNQSEKYGVAECFVSRLTERTEVKWREKT